jgi:triosephosphate isomerase
MFPPVGGRHSNSWKEKSYPVSLRSPTDETQITYPGMKKMRRPIIAGNWKMNTTIDEAISLVESLRDLLPHRENVDIVVCPPFTMLADVCQALKRSSIRLGAQNMHWEPQGAFTGEVSAKMLLTAGCQYVILGHSERRHHFGETDEGVQKKVAAALISGLRPILCLGERLEERERGQTEEVVSRQLKKAVEGLSSEEMLKIVIAYEPVWAIGTGKAATPEMANDVHHYLREVLKDLYSEPVASSVRIQYGGSVTEENAASLLIQPDIDGALVGGASLKAESFARIVHVGSETMGGYIQCS